MNTSIFLNLQITTTLEQTSVKYYQNTKFVIHENASENIVCKILIILSRGRWVKKTYHAVMSNTAHSQLYISKNGRLNMISKYFYYLGLHIFNNMIRKLIH